MNNWMKHLLIWSPIVGLILFFSYTPWVEKYLYRKGSGLLRRFICIALWQGCWLAGSIISAVFVLDGYTASYQNKCLI